MTFYTGTQFPEKYRGGIFFAQHGSWNRTVPIGARVSFASLKPDGTGDKAEVFAEGWLNEKGAYDGRPWTWRSSPTARSRLRRLRRRLVPDHL